MILLNMDRLNNSILSTNKKIREMKLNEISKNIE